MTRDPLELLVLDQFFDLTLPEKISLINSLCCRRLWSEQLLAVWSSIAKRPLNSDQRMIISRELIALAPWSKEAEEAFKIVLGEARPRTQQLVDQVFMVISCAKYMHKARHMLDALAGRLTPVFVVIGASEIRVARIDQNFLYVPAPDTYEGLPKKVFEGILAIRQMFGPVRVVKVDDDLPVLVQHNSDAAKEFLSGIDYAGRPAGGEKFDRCWHIGKCANPETLPYGRRYYGPWARGAIYALSPTAIECILREYLFYPGEMEGEYFEDKLVADMLRRCGIELSYCDVGALFGLLDTEEIAPAFLNDDWWAGEKLS